MSKYNKYAKELDKAFKEARKAYREEAKVVSIAEKFSSIGKTDAELIVAQQRYNDAKSEFRHEANVIWQNFNIKAQAIRDALNEEIQSDNMANPADIDTNALELIKTGVLSPAEYEKLAGTFKNNPTMCKMLAHYADRQAQDTTDNNAKAEYRAIADELRNSKNVRLQDFDAMVNIADYCSGHGTQGQMNQSSYVLGMADRWEEFTADSIAEF